MKFEIRNRFNGSVMDSGALEWWKEWKGFVLSMSLGHQQRIAKK